jgi:hypothetical protein
MIGIMWMKPRSDAPRQPDWPLLVLNCAFGTLVPRKPYQPAAGGTCVIHDLSKPAWISPHAPSSGGGAATRQSIPGFALGGAVYLAGTLIAAFWSPIAALIIFGALAVYYLFEHLPSPAEEAAAGKPSAG